MQSKNQWVVEEKRENVCVLMYGTGKLFLDIYSMDNNISIEFTFIPDKSGFSPYFGPAFIKNCVSLHDFTYVEQYNPKCFQIRTATTNDHTKLREYFEEISEYFPEVYQMKYALLNVFNHDTPKKLVEKYGNWDLLRNVQCTTDKIQYTHKEVSIEISPISEKASLVAFSFTPESFKIIKSSLISRVLVNEENPKFCFRCETPEIREKLMLCVEAIDKHYPLYDKKFEIFNRCGIECNDASSEYEETDSSEESIESSPKRRYSV